MGSAWSADLEWIESRGRARSSERVVDVGAVDGEAGRAFARFTPCVVAADRDAPALRLRHASPVEADAGQLHAVAAGLDALPFADGSFGTALCRGVAHRFPELLPVLRQIARVLAPRGTLLVADTAGPDDPALAQFERALAQRRDPRHVRAFRPIEWAAFLRAVGLTVIDEAELTRVHDWDEWTLGSGMAAEARRELDRFVLAASAHVRKSAGLELEGNRVVSFTERVLLLRADKD